MKKSITLALASVILLCLSITAYADFSIPDLDIAIPEKLQEIIDSYDTSELTAAVKEKLDDVKLMSDDELFLYIKDFCVKYSVELDEEQMHKLAEYIKGASSLSTDEIREKIDSVKSASGFFDKAVGFFKDIGSKIGRFFSSLSDIGRNIADELVELYIRYF